MSGIKTPFIFYKETDRGITKHVRMLDTGQHDLLPGLARAAAEEQQHGPAEALEVVVAVDVGLVVQRDPPEHLHPHHAVDEEDEGDEDRDPGQRLEGLEEGPEEGADALVLVEQLHQPRHTEQPQEPDGGVTVGLQLCQHDDIKETRSIKECSSQYIAKIMILYYLAGCGK